MKNVDIVLVGSASRTLGSKLQNYDMKVINVEHKTFPDGESYVCIPANIRGQNILLLQSTYPPQDKHLIELFLTINAAKSQGAKHIIVVSPYLAYTRQDSMFKPGECISLRTIIHLIENSGASAFITYNIHKSDTIKWFNIPALNLSAVKVLMEYFLKIDLKDPIILSPDKGAINLAKEAAMLLHSEYSYLEKSRDRNTGKVRTLYKNIQVTNRDVIIIDDIISSGSTIANVAKIATNQGARTTIATCIHPLLSNNAVKRLKEAGISEIIGTDCIENDYSKVSVASTLAEALRIFP